jgi:hypothetical protein
MARVAKMPDVQRQKKGNGYRFIIKKRWPKDVQADVGKGEWFRHTFPVAYSQEEANRETPFILEREFWPKVKAKRGNGWHVPRWDSDYDPRDPAFFLVER